MTRTLAAVVAGLIITSAVQAAPLPGFALAAQTEHFTFYTRGEKVDVQKSERYLAHVEQLLGQKVAGRAEYYRYGSPEEVAAGTGTYASGVTFATAGQIHSTQDFHAHEIVHLVAGQLGNPGPFFHEGLAVALGNEGKWNGKDVHKVAKSRVGNASVTTLIAGFDRVNPQTSYPLAGSFVARLIQTHGLAKVVEFFRACKGGERSVPAAFSETFGESLESADVAWVGSL